MNEATLADRLRVIVAWIRDGGEGCVREPDLGELEGMADEIEVLVDQSNDELRFENDRLRDRIAKLKGVLLAASYEGPKASHHKVLMIGRYVIDFDTADGDPVRAVLDEDQADDVHHKGPAQ